MPIVNINLGTAPDNGTGDTARAAGAIINANFAFLEALVSSITGGVKINGNNAILLKAPLNTGVGIEVGDQVEVFANNTTILKAKYTNALADGDLNNLGITPNWNTGNYTPISISEL